MTIKMILPINVAVFLGLPLYLTVSHFPSLSLSPTVLPGPPSEVVTFFHPPLCLSEFTPSNKGQADPKAGFAEPSSNCSDSA